jgi:hypothetical protein
MATVRFDEFDKFAVDRTCNKFFKKTDWRKDINTCDRETGLMSSSGNPFRAQFFGHAPTVLTLHFLRRLKRGKHPRGSDLLLALPEEDFRK